MESSKNSTTPEGKRFSGGVVKKYLFFTLLWLGASFALLGFPFAAKAGILHYLSSLFGQTTNAASGGPSNLYNSQTMALLKPAVNLDPNPSKGGGDILLTPDGALVPSGSPDGYAELISRPSSSQISVHTVRSGETLSNIAELYGVSTNTIRWANDIARGDIIHPGQELIILPITGVRHAVVSGETLASIAKKYNSDVQEIANYNELAVEGALAVGQVIIVPDGTIAASPTLSTVPTPPSSGVAGSFATGYYQRPLPSQYPRTQGLHGYNGIDIGAPVGTPAQAAAAGTVIIARVGGWNGGYGNYVVIQHNNGTQTLYAHTNAVLVSVGEHVVQGQTIATVGLTGRTTGAHLHFEVRGARNPF